MNRNLIAVMCLGACCALLTAQDSEEKKPQPKKSELDKLLDRAAKNHPEIGVASTKVEHSLAELEQARASVMQAVVEHYYAKRVQRTKIAAAESELKRLHDLMKKNAASRAELEKSKHLLEAEMAKYEELEATLKQFVGGDKAAKPSSKKTELERLLERAAKSHPDIKVATTMVRHAQAELEQSRAAVSEQIVSLYFARKSQLTKIAAAESNLARLSRLMEKALVSRDELEKAKQLLISEKAKLEELETTLQRYAGPETSERIASVLELRLIQQWQAARLGGLNAVERAEDRSPLAEKMLKRLNQPVGLKLEGSYKDLMAVILEKMDGFTLVDRSKNAVKDEHRMFNLTDVPLGAVFQMFEDLEGKHVFLVREYGILVVAPDDVPEGAVRLVEFWKQASKKEKK